MMNNKSFKSVQKILFMISLMVFIYSLVNLIYIGYEFYINKKLNDLFQKETSQMFKINKDKNLKINNNNGNIEKLLSVNEDIKGVIVIDGTRINYPIVKGNDNEFYIKHNIKKNKSKYGAIFIDYRNKLNNNLSGENLILYGHNMKDRSMFYDLNKFKNKEFFLNNNIDLVIFPKKYKVEVFSVLIIKSDFDYRKSFFYNNEELNKYLKKIRQASLYFKDIKLNYQDTILTMSTCSYEFKNCRLVIQGKVLEI